MNEEQIILEAERMLTEKMRYLSTLCCTNTRIETDLTDLMCRIADSIAGLRTANMSACRCECNNTERKPGKYR